MLNSTVDRDEAKAPSSASAAGAGDRPLAGAVQLQPSGSVEGSSEHVSPPKTPSAVSLTESMQSATHSEFPAFQGVTPSSGVSCDGLFSVCEWSLLGHGSAQHNHGLLLES